MKWLIFLILALIFTSCSGEPEYGDPIVLKHFHYTLGMPKAILKTIADKNYKDLTSGYGEKGNFEIFDFSRESALIQATLYLNEEDKVKQIIVELRKPSAEKFVNELLKCKPEIKDYNKKTVYNFPDMSISVSPTNYNEKITIISITKNYMKEMMDIIKEN